MAPLFAPSASELDHLRSAVKALGITTVPGLAAALSWRQHKTEKLLAHELGQPNTPLVYDPARRTVRWAAALVPPAASVASPAASPAPATRSFRTTPSAPAPVYTPTGLKTLCPHCHVALQSTGSAGLVVCPSCGRLSSARGATGAPGPVTRRPAPVASAAPAPATPGSDRRSQEMFAAWLTNQAIPCPKCRTPLRHRGVSEYSCPACGQQVRFPNPHEKPAPVPVAAQ
jgi:uncharacterized Zn finger protein (UPF0148 family)